MQCQNVARWLDFPAALLLEVHLTLRTIDPLTFGRLGLVTQHFQHVAIVPHWGFHVCTDMVNADMMNSLETFAGFGPGLQMESLRVLFAQMDFRFAALSR